MNEERFYQDLLALPGLRVTAVEKTSQRIIVHAQVQVEATPCPVCGEPTARVNQYDTCKDLSISRNDVGRAFP